MKTALTAILIAASTALADPETIPRMPADSVLDPIGPMPAPKPSGGSMPLIGKIAAGTFLFAIGECGIILYAAGFAESPLGGSLAAGAFGLLAAANASGPDGSKVTLLQAGGVIAYNLIRFGPQLEVSDKRSERIFAENLILMNGVVLTALTVGLIREQRAKKAKAPAVALSLGPEKVALARTWTF